MGYHVQTPVFQGPLDVLLHLVNSHEVDVLDIPIAPIVDGFVAELARLMESPEDLALDGVSEFLLLAAILVEIKSKALLPGEEEVEEDEELAAWDTRDVLLARLLECRAYAAAGEAFAMLIDLARLSVPREAGLDDDFVVHAPDLLRGVSAQQVAAAYQRATAIKAPPSLDLSHVTVDKVSVSEAVEELAALLPERRQTSFRTLTAHLAARIEIIVRFLALLELCKLGKVTLGQGRTFGDLEVFWIAGDHEAALTAEAVRVDDYDG